MPTKEELLGALSGADLGMVVLDDAGNPVITLDFGDTTKLILESTDLEESTEELVTAAYELMVKPVTDPETLPDTECWKGKILSKHGEDEETWWEECVQEPATEITELLIRGYATAGGYEVKAAQALIAAINPTTQDESSILVTPEEIAVKAYASCILEAMGEESAFGAYLHVDEAEGCEQGYKNETSEITSSKVTDRSVAHTVPHSSGSVSTTINNDRIVDVKSLSAAYQLQANVAAESIAWDWQVYSDERLKEDIRDLEESKLSQLKPRVFTQNGKEQAFFVADEVEEVFPNSVKMADNGYKGTSLKEILAHTVKELQDLRAEFELYKIA